MVDNFEEDKHKFLLELEKYPFFNIQLQNYSNEIRSNKDLVLLLLSTTKNILNLGYISENLLKCKDIFLLVINYNELSFCYAHVKI